MHTRWVHLGEVASTMDEAHRLARSGAPHATAVRADRQTAGRGRLDRPWTSPPGGLWMSVILRPKAPVARWSLLPLAAGCAVAAALRASQVDARVKWPNDVQVAGRKVAGILVETRLPEYAVVGVGVNAGVSPTELPAALASSAGTVPLAASSLADPIASGILVRAQRLDQGEGSALLAEWRALSATLGTEVTRGDVRGVAVDVDEDGALLVRTAPGRIERLTEAP